MIVRVVESRREVSDFDFGREHARRGVPSAPGPPEFDQRIPDLVEEHYIRFLHNGFRETYPFTGNPLRILMRKKS